MILWIKFIDHTLFPRLFPKHRKCASIGRIWSNKIWEEIISARKKRIYFRANFFYKYTMNTYFLLYESIFRRYSIVSSCDDSEMRTEKMKTRTESVRQLDNRFDRNRWLIHHTHNGIIHGLPILSAGKSGEFHFSNFNLPTRKREIFQLSPNPRSRGFH